MKRKTTLMFLSTVILELVLFAILFQMFGGWNNNLWYLPAAYALHISLAMVSVSFAIYVHNHRTDSIETGLKADDSFRLVQEHLKAIGYATGSTDQRVVVLLDRDRNARIEVVDTPRGSDLLVYPSLTTNGLGSMVSYCVILPFCGLVGLWMSFRSARKTEEFSVKVLRPTMIYLEANEKAKPKASEQQEIQSVITSTLRRADHLASEALTALKVSYNDTKWTIPLVGFIAYAVLAFGLILTRNADAAWPPYYTLFLEFMLVAFTAIVVLSSVWLRLRYGRESEEMNVRLLALRAAISREEGTAKLADGDEAALETLLKVCPDLPRWTKYRTRNFYLRNPGISTMMGWSLFVMVMTWFSVSTVGLGLVAGIAFLSILTSLYLGTKWMNLRNDRRTLAQWSYRIGTIKTEFETKLQEL